MNKKGECIYLTAKEFDLLYFLFCHKGQVFTKDQLYENVWGFHNAPEGSNLTSFIRKLRKKIEPFPDNPQYILTVWGAGYNICIFTNLTAHTIIPPIKLMRGALFDGSQAASPSSDRAVKPITYFLPNSSYCLHTIPSYVSSPSVIFIW